MSTSVVYPARSSAALGFLKSASNDIEVFVEDSSCPNMWVKLLRRYLPQNVRLDSVNIMGGRSSVLAACAADQENDGRKKIYIIDADLDILKGKAKPRLKHLYRLRAYCVENYLIDENSLVKLATLFDPEIPESRAFQRLGFGDWCQMNSENYEKLFIWYAVVHEFDVGLPTINFSVHRLLDHTNYCLCDQLTGRRLFNLIKNLLVANSNNIRGRYKVFKKNAVRSNFLKYVSAKDYVIPLLYNKMRAEFGLSVKIPVFKTILAEFADPALDPYLKRRLNQIVSR